MHLCHLTSPFIAPFLFQLHILMHVSGCWLIFNITLTLGRLQILITSTPFSLRLPIRSLLLQVLVTCPLNHGLGHRRWALLVVPSASLPSWAHTFPTCSPAC